MDKKTKRDYLTAIAMITVATVVGAAPEIALASADPNTIIEEVLNKMLDIVCLIAAAMGIAMASFGIIQAISAHKADNPEERNRAISQVVTGVVLIGAPQLIKAFDLIQYLPQI